MPAIQKGPGKTELRHYLAQGMTQAEIVEKWEVDSGVRVSRSTIAMAIERYGLKSAHPRPRYEDLLPWHVRQQHLMHNDARMLRLEGRRRAGHPLSDRDKRLLQGWREQLNDAGAVIMYEPNTDEGFHWVHRRASDEGGLIRKPKGRKRRV